MTRYIAEFLLDSGMKLPEASAPLKWDNEAEDFRLTIHNRIDGFSFTKEVLSAHLIFSAENLSDATEKCQDLLASILNALVWCSMSMFRQARLVRVVDWSPNLTMRAASIFSETPKFAVPSSMLVPDLITTAEMLYASQRDKRTQTVLRWFRLGIGADNLDEQFTYLWFSLETAAEALKSSGKVPSSCPVCESALFCKTCDTHPLHRKFSADAIRDLIVSSFGDESTGKKSFHVLTKIRHAVMHGRRISSVSGIEPYDSQLATNELAQISRNAILRMSDFSSYNNKNLEISIVSSEDIARGNLVTAAHVESVFYADPENRRVTGPDGIKVSIRYPGQPDDPS